MGRAYSIDLRERILNDIDANRNESSLRTKKKSVNSSPIMPTGPAMQAIGASAPLR